MFSHLRETETEPFIIVLSDSQRTRCRHGEEHWIHDEASITGPLFGRGAQHLLKRDGTNVTILQEAFGQWIS